VTSQLSIILALSIGFTHAFEIDHLIAVGNLVSKGKKTINAIKEGALWGLGHTSSIFIIGLLVLLLKTKIDEQTFSYLEGLVGLMLIGLGIWRVIVSYKKYKHDALHQSNQPHSHDGKLAYGVGLIHGLAGSGALILLVLSQSENSVMGMMYLLMFGIGSIAGMMVASGLFSIPFVGRLQNIKLLGQTLTFASAALCIYIGFELAYTNFQ
jgi:high-affinity nickel permease